MALRELVEGECGGANSLVRLTSHVVQDRGLKEEGFRHNFPHGEGFSGSNTDQLVQQFFEETLGHGNPTFRMDTLLAEMRDLERGLSAGPPPIQSPPIAQLAAEHDVSCWADQYLEAGKHFQDTALAGSHCLVCQLNRSADEGIIRATNESLSKCYPIINSHI